MPFNHDNNNYYYPLNGLFSRTTWLSQQRKGKTSLDLNEARDNGVLGGSGISWTICNQAAPCSRHITTPTPHHFIQMHSFQVISENQCCFSVFV